jgi:NAD(P)-dependent dehydrogenase (short-subunit alcohol dehydrogenase family)
MSTVLITGANRGIGAELVKQYAAAGWDVIATARNKKNISSDDRSGKKVDAHELDVSDENSIQTLTDALNGRPIDLLIHNAAIYPRGGSHLGSFDYGSWHEAMKTNFFGALRVTEALIENIAASEKKQIAAISSGMSSLRAVSGGDVARSGTSYQYRTSKTALNMAMLVMSKELEPRGISVVLLCPGWVKTDMGGANAAITPETSVAGMRKLLDDGGMKISGKFLGYDGAVRPW